MKAHELIKKPITNPFEEAWSERGKGIWSAGLHSVLEAKILSTKEKPRTYSQLFSNKLKLDKKK